MSDQDNPSFDPTFSKLSFILLDSLSKEFILLYALANSEVMVFISNLTVWIPFLHKEFDTVELNINKFFNLTNALFDESFKI
ncbi:Uncharacterised protein [Mycoplasma putrefaciens]|nr:Uncharacterised protein [Mycoplasma putrefaciens]